MPCPRKKKQGFRRPNLGKAPSLSSLFFLLTCVGSGIVVVPSAISSSGYGLAVCLWSWRPRRRCYDIPPEPPPLLAGGSESEGPALQRGIWLLFLLSPLLRGERPSAPRNLAEGGRSQTDGGVRSVEPRAAAVGRKGNGQTAPGIMYSREEEKDGILLPFFHCSSFTWSLRRRKEKEFVRRLRWLVVVWYFHLKEMESSIPSSLLSVFPLPSSFCFSSADCLSHGGDLSSLPLLLRVTNGDDSLPLPLHGASARTQKRILLPFLPLSSQSAVIAQPISLSLFSHRLGGLRRVGKEWIDMCLPLRRRWWKG